MAQTIKLKRSATSGAIPTTAQLDLGEVAINTYDGKMYIKKDVGGTESIVEIGAGGAASEAVWKQYSYTATAGQTVFSGADDNSATLSYIPDFIEVFLNGVLLDPAVDYTATTSSSVVLASAASLNDLLQINAFVQVIGTADIIVDTFTGDGTTAEYTLSATASVKENINVFIDGVYQENASYTLNGTTLTLSENLPNTSIMDVVIGTNSVTLDNVEGLTVNSLQLTGGTGSQGTFTWNDIDGTVDLDLGTASLQIGQEHHFYAKATEAIANGDVVMFAGAQGDHVLIAKADHDAVGFKPEYIMGVATQAFANNQFGYVTTFGKVRGLNTSTLDEGDILYSDPDNAGALTITRPSSPDHIIQIAAVLSSNSAQGVILVRPTHFLDTDEVEEGSTNLYFTDARAISAIQSDASWNASNWDTAYTYSQVGHLPLTGGTITGNLTVTGLIQGNTSVDGGSAASVYLAAQILNGGAA